MGAWGYGYRDNDNYYNEAGKFVAPLVEWLRAELSGEHDTEDLRARLMWTAGVLSGSDEIVSLSRDELVVFRDAVHRVREEATENAGSWVNPEEYLSTVERELDVVEEWLRGFKETGFLEDRLGAILQENL